MLCTFAFEAIGTAWRIMFFEELSAARQIALLRLVQERIEGFDRVYSRFRTDSTVSEMARRAGVYALDDGGPLLETYERFYQITNGSFTPLIGQTLSDAGYDATYSLKPKSLSTPPAWDDVMEVQGATVTMKRPALLDFGAAGKGYLVDLVAELLQGEGALQFCIDAGGDILYQGEEPLRVGLEDPEHTDRAVGIATVSSGSVCGSAGNRRAWGPFHHVVHPHTLSSPREALATWVFAPSARVADALSTCFYLLPPRILADRLAADGMIGPFEYAVLFADRHVEHSPGAPVEFFTA